MFVYVSSYCRLKPTMWNAPSGVPVSSDASGRSWRAQLRFHVEPRRVDALAVDVGASIEEVVEDLQTEMRLRDLVDLGKGERETQPHGLRVLANRAALVAEIAPRLVDETQELFVGQVRTESRLSYRARRV